MIQLLSNKKIMTGLVTVLIVIVLIIIAVFLLNNRQSHPITKVFVTTGGEIKSTGDWASIGALDTEKGFQYDLPILADLAIKEGWVKASSCISGEGIYYSKAQEENITLIFDVDENLIGVYQNSDVQMPVPWMKTNGPSKSDGSYIFDKEHYGVYLFILDPSNACDLGTSYDSILASPSGLPSYSIPINVDEAIAQGWPDPIFCSQGRGKYYSNPVFNYIIMYNGDGNPIGIYQYSEESKSAPWWKTKEILSGGLKVVEQEHYGLFIFFADATRACSAGQQKSTKTGSSQSLYLGQGVRATPTPYVEPTPTPEPSTMIPTIIEKLSQLKTIELEVTSDPEGLSSVTEIEASEFTSSLTAVLGSLREISYASNTWINNVSYKGIKGITKSDNMTSLVPDALNGKSIEVTVWLAEDGTVKKIKLIGEISGADSNQSARTFNVNIGY